MLTNSKLFWLSTHEPNKQKYKSRFNWWNDLKSLLRFLMFSPRKFFFDLLAITNSPSICWGGGGGPWTNRSTSNNIGLYWPPNTPQKEVWRKYDDSRSTVQYAQVPSQRINRSRPHWGFNAWPNFWPLLWSHWPPRKHDADRIYHIPLT